MNLRRILGFAALFILLASARPLQAAIITNVTPPMSARGLHVIDIFGNGFAPGGLRPTTLSVDFNGVVSTLNPLSVVADWHIQVTNVPAAASSGYIHVSINGGAAAQSPQPFIIISTNAYVTNFTPTYGSVDTPVTISGVQFQSGNVTNVSFNGVLAKTFFLNGDNQISVTAPGGVTTGPLILLSKFGASHNFSTVSNEVSSATNFYAQATIAIFSPTNGRPGTNVVLTGTNFTAISGIAFGSVNASDFTVSNNTSIRVTVPAGASTGKITLSPPANTFLSAALSTTNFRILPNILSFSPPSGTNNTLVTVTGSGLNEQSPAPLVTVGSGVVTSFGTISPNTLTFNVPATATSGNITVNTTNGSATSSQLFYLPAAITNFVPTNGASGTIVTITGKNFTNASAVTFSGIPAMGFGVTNNNTIVAIAPVGVTSGTLSVTTPFGTTNSSALFYVAPTITDITPNHGLPGARITITGTSFTNASAVSFNGAAAASFSVTNNTTLSAVVPNGVTTGPISVTAPGGTGVSANNFVVDATDIGISGVDAPDPVFIGSNLVYAITITNNGPVAALNVRFTNTLPASVILQSATISQGTLFTNTVPVTGSLGNLNSQSTATVLLVVKPAATGFITNNASIGTDSFDANSVNDSVSIVTTVWPLPFLSITNLMSNNLVQIKWPAPLSNFTLQSRTDLSPDAFWSNDVTPKVVTGTNVTVIETNIGTPKYFRLTN
jgi:uncharacterized repeat protein (TIGR01451 family)